jgi:hypothetical protein
MPERLTMTGEVVSHSCGHADDIVGWDVRPSPLSDDVPLRLALETFWGERVRVTIEVLPDEVPPARPPERVMVAAWADLSGHGHHLTQADPERQPEVTQIVIEGDSSGEPWQTC